jgi:hypothetical protein
MTPIIILCGQAGSGKDTVGARISSHYNGFCVGQADPIKRMAQSLFGFTDEQLWGPSDSRNAVDHRSLCGHDGSLSPLLNEVGRKIVGGGGVGSGEYWVNQFFKPELQQAAMSALHFWFVDLIRSTETSGVSPRIVLQSLGTDWGRRIDPEVWIEMAIETCSMVLGGEYTYSKKTGLTRGSSSYNAALITDGRFRNEITKVRGLGGISVKIDRPTRPSIGVASLHISETGLDDLPIHLYDYVVLNNSGLESLNNKADYLIQEVLGRPKVL